MRKPAHSERTNILQRPGPTPWFRTALRSGLVLALAACATLDDDTESEPPCADASCELATERSARAWQTLSPPFAYDAFPLPVRFRPRRFTSVEITAWKAALHARPGALRESRLGGEVLDVALVQPATPLEDPEQLFVLDPATGHYPNLAPDEPLELEIVTRDRNGIVFPLPRLLAAARYFAKPQYYYEAGATQANRSALEAKFFIALVASPTVPIQQLLNPEARRLIERPFPPGLMRNCYTAAHVLVNPILGRYPETHTTRDWVFCAAGPRPGCDQEPALARVSHWYEYKGTFTPGAPDAADQVGRLELGDVLGPNNSHVWGYLVAGFRFQKLSLGSHNLYHIVRDSPITDSPESHAVVFRRRDPSTDPAAAIPAALAHPNALTRANTTAALRLATHLTARDVTVINDVFGTTFTGVEALAQTVRCQVVYVEGGEESFRVDDTAALRQVFGSATRAECGCAWAPFPFVPARWMKLVEMDGTLLRSIRCAAKTP